MRDLLRKLVPRRYARAPAVAGGARPGLGMPSAAGRIADYVLDDDELRACSAVPEGAWAEVPGNVVSHVVGAALATLGERFGSSGTVLPRVLGGIGDRLRARGRRRRAPPNTAPTRSKRRARAGASCSGTRSSGACRRPARCRAWCRSRPRSRSPCGQRAIDVLLGGLVAFLVATALASSLARLAWGIGRRRRGAPHDGHGQPGGRGRGGLRAGRRGVAPRLVAHGAGPRPGVPGRRHRACRRARGPQDVAGRCRGRRCAPDVRRHRELRDRCRLDGGVAC